MHDTADMWCTFLANILGGSVSFGNILSAKSLVQATQHILKLESGGQLHIGSTLKKSNTQDASRAETTLVGQRTY